MLMENILLYPTLSPEMLEAAGLSVDKYHFTYEYQEKYFSLHQKGSTTLKLSDSLEIWNVETEGLILDKTVCFAYPNLLKGKNGVACKGAEIGICIIWTNKKLTQTGIILPVSDVESPQGRNCKFHYMFAPGRISGDLELSLSMFIKSEAGEILEDEEDLINEAGVTVGEIEHVVLDFNSLYMEFPIEEYKSENEPLWWIEFSEWEDPKTIDMFTKDSLCLYLNPYYDACPAPSTSDSSNSIKNFDLMVDILAQTYLMIFQRLSDDDLKATRQNVGLTNNSICSILHQFIEDCYEELHWESPEKLLKSLQINIRKKLQEDT